MKRRIFVILKWVLLLYLIYLAAGALLPFVHTKKTGEAFKNNFKPASFYSETKSVDRARVVETSMDALESRVPVSYTHLLFYLLSHIKSRENQSSLIFKTFSSFKIKVVIYIIITNEGHQCY